MSVFDRQQRKKLDELVEDFTQHRVSRREFLQRTMAVGLSASAATSLLVACGGNPSNGGGSTSTPQTVDVLNVWGGEEQASFKAVVAPFTSRTGIQINVESTRDLDAVLTTRIRGNDPPDIAILPNPAKMQQLASQHKLIALDSFLDMNTMHSYYSSSWLDLGSYNGSLYALFYKAANKGTVWYNPKQFQALGLQTPSTWQDLITLSNQIASKGKYPWSMGVSSAAASGWPAADWIAEIYLNQSGPAMYDQWWKHQIPWTDPSVKHAFQMFGQIVGGKHYINGAPQSILATGFQPASYLPFENPPGAYMYYLGDFTAGFITSQSGSALPGTDFDFFPFPTINSQYQGAVTGGADVVVVMKDNSAVRQLVQYLAAPDAQVIWIKRGGFTSPNKLVDLSAYPDPVAKASAQMLASAPFFRFGADDLMPPPVETAFWKATLTFIQDQSQLDNILNQLESTAQQAYQQNS
jgi:alpha-glucoside transport system substrate-binding protein